MYAEENITCILRKCLRIKNDMSTHNPTTEKTVINDSSRLFYWHMYVFIHKIQIFYKVIISYALLGDLTYSI